jgi:hypothetical protein
MVRAASALAILTFAALASSPPMAVVGVAATAAPGKSGTPPPEIYHIVTRPLCAELHQHIAPAIAMMLQNDHTIKQSPALFSQYNRSALYGVDNSVSNSAGNSSSTVSQGDASNGTLNADQNMALLGMENLVSPIANNIIATQKLLDSPALTQGTGNPEDDKQLQDMRAKLLQALATQSAALDIVSGFVATEQMGDLQHAGEEYIGAIDQSDATGARTNSTPTPNPLLQNANQPGLPPNPYSIDLANVPGLTLGYNPVTRLLQALRWTINETQQRENAASVAVMNGAQACAAQTPQPAASPKPQ